MNTFSAACVLAFLGVAHGFSMTMNSAERTYIMVRKNSILVVERRYCRRFYYLRQN